MLWLNDDRKQRDWRGTDVNLLQETCETDYQLSGYTKYDQPIITFTQGLENQDPTPGDGARSRGTVPNSKSTLHGVQ